MGLSFSDMQPDDRAERERARRRRQQTDSGPLSIYGFDAEDDAAEEAEAPPRPPEQEPREPKRSDSTAIYGFDVDPDTLAGELIDAAAGPEDPPAPAPPAPRATPGSRPPRTELMAAVAAALTEDDDDEEDDDEIADEGPPIDLTAGDEAEGDRTPASAFPEDRGPDLLDLPEGSWLDTPAGPEESTPPYVPTSKPTETVSTDDVLKRKPRAQPAPPKPAAKAPADTPSPAPAEPEPAAERPPNAWGSSTQEIAEELLKAVDEEKRGVASGSSEDDLAALLSAAIAGPAEELPRRGNGKGTGDTAADPSQVPTGDFRAVAAGLIAELEASLIDSDDPAR